MSAISLPRLRVNLVVALVASILLAMAAGLVARADAAKPQRQKVTKGPGGLKFYKPPKLTPRRHGQLIWATKAGGLVPLANAEYTKLVLYASRSPQNQRVVISGSVAVPKGKPPKGGWPVITWAHGTTGVADSCAPTRDYAGTPTPTGETYINDDLNSWLAAGYAVLRTDYQGLGTPGPHPYLIGTSEGRSVLDIVTAARQLDSRIGRRYVIAGHSQGGQAALFAAGLASTWAPKLRLRGTVAFAPASHILEQTSLLPGLTSPSPLTALATTIVYGATTQSPAINVNALLSDRVLAFYPLLEQQCLPRLGQSDELGGIPPSQLLRQNADRSAIDPVLGGMNPAIRTNAPLLIAQGDADTTVFPFTTDQLRDELTALGDPLTYRKYPGVNHTGIVTAAAPDALAFITSVLPPR